MSSSKTAGSPPAIAQRKADHIEIAASGRADFAQRTTLLEHVHLVHDALPEFALADVELATMLVGRQLAAPLMITGMTGGTAQAAAINRDLAKAADFAGIAFGVGSQRAMADHPDLEATYLVRDVAPDVVLLGNIGGVQALTMGSERVAELARRLGADAMAIHLNPGQELIQANGDRNFAGVLDNIARMVDALPVPLIVKETGCGLSPRVIAKLFSIGVRTVDVSGAGGTSWVAVEAQRAAEGSDAASLGRELWDWGVPTAVTVAAAAEAGMTTIASGGVRNGLDVARALALGADVGGMAAPYLRAWRSGGESAVRVEIERVTASLRSICLLTGARRAGDLRHQPRHLGSELATWLTDLGIGTHPHAPVAHKPHGKK